MEKTVSEAMQYRRSVRVFRNDVDLKPGYAQKQAERALPCDSGGVFPHFEHSKRFYRFAFSHRTQKTDRQNFPYSLYCTLEVVIFIKKGVVVQTPVTQHKKRN